METNRTVCNDSANADNDAQHSTHTQTFCRVFKGLAIFEMDSIWIELSSKGQVQWTISKWIFISNKS